MPICTQRALALCLFCIGVAENIAAQSNVLLIIGDDVGRDDVGCYGTPGAPPTPNIDALAAGGVRFRRAYANPACAPTRAALLTGRYGFRTGVPTSLGPTELGVRDNEVLLPALLQPPQFATALIGKWNLGVRHGDQSPNVQGFQHFSGVMGPGVPDYYQWVKLVNGTPIQVNTYATTDQVNDAIAWIGQQTNPWFLSLSLTAPHEPYHIPPSHLHTRNIAGFMPTTTPLPFVQAAIEALDTEIGRLLASMSPSVRANTNIIFMSDNGTDAAVARPPLIPSHAKGSLYEGGCNVPLIVNGPSVAVSGTTTDAIVSVVDLFPTIMNLMGAPLTGIVQPLDGVTIAPLLAGTATGVRDHAYVDMAASPYGGGYSIRDANYELVRILGQLSQHQEFYDLAVDPFEQNDLLQAPMSPQHQAAFDHLTSLLAGYRTDGWVELFGSGCSGSAGEPRIRAQTMPRIGLGHIYQLVNVPASTPGMVGIAGFDRRLADGIPLPFDLSPIGMAGCSLLVSIDTTVPTFVSTGFGYMALPNYVGYLGLEFYLQGFVIDQGANQGSLVATRGMRCIIGQ